MRPLALLIVALVFVGCSDTTSTPPAAPTTLPTPPPPAFPSLLGAYTGTWRSHISTRVPIPGVRRSNSTVDCAATLLITDQLGGNWRGTFIITGHPHCEQTGPTGGTINEGRVVTLGRADEVFVTELGPCRLVYNDTLYRGSVTTEGRLTLEQDFIERCSFPPGDLDYTVQGSFALTKQ
jgi:hypothetical protein